MTRGSVHIAFLAITTAVLACTSGIGMASSAREVEDSTGRKVPVPEHPTRVLSLCTTATDTAVRLGAAGQLAGIDEYSRVVPGASNLLVLGKGTTLSREQILARGIDLAFVWWFQEDAARMLEELRVPTLRIRCGRVDEVPQTIRCVGDALGTAEAAARLADEVRQEIDLLRHSATTNGPRVYVELYSPFKTSGQDSFVNDLVELAGGRNVATEAKGAVLFSSEQLLRSDPEVVLLMRGFGTPGDFGQRGGFKELSAVKARRVYVIDRYHLVAGAGIAGGIAELRRMFNPESQTRR